LPKRFDLQQALSVAVLPRSRHDHENAAGEALLAEIRKWYPGSVCTVRELLPGAVIKDEMISRVLAKVSEATSVTTNVSDFWQVIRADPHFCVICLPIPTDRRDEISAVLRSILRLPQFRTKRLRAGSVILSTPHGVRFYGVNDMIVKSVPWQHRKQP